MGRLGASFLACFLDILCSVDKQDETMTDYIDFTQIYAARDDLGTTWLDFEDTLVREQAIIFNTAYNLISLSLKENSLSTIITTILNDEEIDLNNKIIVIRKTLVEGLIELSRQLGIILNLDYIDLDSLQSLCEIINTLISLDGSDDVLGLTYILDNETYDNKDKLIECIIRVNGLDDEGMLPYMIEEVSGSTIKGLYYGLNQFDIEDGEYVNPDITRRIKQNKLFLAGTLAENHIINGGGVGLEFSLLMNHFIHQLSPLLMGDKKAYLKEILGLCLISSLTSVEIQEGFEGTIKDLSDTVEDIYAWSILLEKVKL